MKRQRAEDGNAVYVPVEDLAREQEEGAVQENIEDGAVEVTVIHEMLVDLRERVQNRQGLENIAHG